MTASQAKQVLSDTMEGTFLLRDSSSPACWLTLSEKTNLGPIHLRIQYAGDHFGFDSLDAAQPRLQHFGGVVELVQHYVLACWRWVASPQQEGVEGDGSHAARFPLKLSWPLYRLTPSLQHLCRVAINQCSRCHQDLPLPSRVKDYLQRYPFVL